MHMQFIVILICLAINRWSQFSEKIRNVNILEKYTSFVLSLFKKKQPKGYLTLIVILLPIFIVTAIVNFILTYVFFGFLAFLFSIAVLLYCLGAFNLSNPDLKASFLQANQNIFSVIFWSIIFGPAGALLYRLNNIVIDYYKKTSDVSKAAQKFNQVLEWIPIRLETLAYALMGNFNVTMRCWMQHARKGLSNNEKMLKECATASLDKDVSLTHALQIIDRALIVWLVIMALVVIT